jgi:hypothetical protein
MISKVLYSLLFFMEIIKSDVKEQEMEERQRLLET